jgi:hypothetical protein
MNIEFMLVKELCGNAERHSEDRRHILILRSKSHHDISESEVRTKGHQLRSVDRLEPPML